MVKPLFTIITVTLNDKNGLGKTIKSVINQGCKDYEYIIIDGESTDGSIDVIKKYEKDITYWVSEKDKGIYDAMNKGVGIAKGQLIFFLNAGDTFYDKKVLQDVKDFYLKNDKPECLYGGINYINPFKGVEYKEIVKERVTLSKIKKGKMIRHQSLFVDKSVFEKVGDFNLSYGFAGDFEFECRLFLNNIECVFLDRVITDFYGGGAGSDLFKSYKMKGRIIRERFGIVAYLRYFFLRGIHILVVYLLRFIGLLQFTLKIRRRILVIFSRKDH
jgi:glycosyltransferase involved in cell wall biosynthesis